MIANPILRLTEKQQKFTWTPECDEAFEHLKSALKSASILAYPEHDKMFILDTDASKEGTETVLAQEVDGEE
ncbi:hypothetical protein JTE90_021355 [Oedothorax gibbosus]|uniref:Reverse transcriptase/retrotransposon-derived protein RNase H-like domain-containing protein n=1 Tax=Oedothorax gibbosus TaxID=931172 RepID=A0AAV6TWT8_9ARAC|nr:hypothetical protein JTE90_021355 [Oedothorax gibbosus]